jgi:endonuclease/exonuclease/phosphatase family metal-dependent hydrolase
VQVTPMVSMQSVKVMTYNVLKLASDGEVQPADGNTVAPWSQRRLGQAQIIRNSGADIVMVQEGGNWVGAGPDSWSSMTGAVRQVDSLQSALAGVGANYAVAHTEATWGQTGFALNFNYILYNPDHYAAVGTGGDWAIGDDTLKANAAWQVLQNRQSGAKLLVVCTHLIPNNGEAYDLAREQETKTMLADAQAKSNALGIPVIYGGDFNTTPLFGMHPVDGPNIAMRAAGIADGHGTAQYKWNNTLDTITGYRRTPHWYSNDIDYLFLPAGVAARTWGVEAELQNGSWPGVIPSDHNAVDGTIAFPY